MNPSPTIFLRRFFGALMLLGMLPLASGCDVYNSRDVVVVGNDIIVRTFFVEGDDFAVSDDQLVGSYARDVDELTTDVVDDGAVLLYADGSLFLSGGAGTWTALPVTIGIDEDDDLFIDYTVSFTYSFDIGDLYIDVISSDTIYPFENLPRAEYKLVMIPGDLFVGNAKAGIDYTDYEAVKRAYNLPD